MAGSSRSWSKYGESWSLRTPSPSPTRFAGLDDDDEASVDRPDDEDDDVSRIQKRGREATPRKEKQPGYVVQTLNFFSHKSRGYLMGGSNEEANEGCLMWGYLTVLSSIFSRGGYLIGRPRHGGVCIPPPPHRATENTARAQIAGSPHQVTLFSV